MRADVCDVRSDGGGDGGVIINEKGDSTLAADREQGGTPLFHLIGGVALCPKLNDIDPAFNHLGGNPNERRRRGITEVDDPVKFGMKECAPGHGETQQGEAGESTGFHEIVFWRTGSLCLARCPEYAESPSKNSRSGCERIDLASLF